MLKSIHRLSKDNDIRLVLGRGRNFFSHFFTLKYLATGKSSRFTVVVSTKVSKLAVRRNRIKRLVREFIKSYLNLMPKGDYVLIIKPTVNMTNEKELIQALSKVTSLIKQTR